MQKIVALDIGRQSLLERLETENGELRDRVVALALQILVLRDGARPMKSPDGSAGKHVAGTAATDIRCKPWTVPSKGRA